MNPFAELFLLLLCHDTDLLVFFSSLDLMINPHVNKEKKETNLQHFARYEIGL